MRVTQRIKNLESTITANEGEESIDLSGLSVDNLRRILEIANKDITDITKEEEYEVMKLFNGIGLNIDIKELVRSK